MDIFEELAKEIVAEAKKNMKTAAEELLHDANNVVPVATGALKASGKVQTTTDGVEVVYDEDYALYVHESPDGKGFKWLERTLVSDIDKYIDIIADGDGK